jgi:hypothetical protein
MKRIAMSVALLTIAAASFAQAPAASATPVANPLLTEARTAYNRVKVNVIKAAEAMTEEGYSFSPTKDERAFLKVAAHVADSQLPACSGILGDRKTGDAEKSANKAELVAKLKASFDVCDKAFDTLTDATATDTSKGRSKLATVWGLYAHNQEQYAIMAAYMRQKGIKPPTAQN